MRLRGVIFIAIAGLITGCVHTRSLKNHTQEELYAKLNATAMKHTGQIRLLKDNKIRALKIHVAKDSTYFLRLDSSNQSFIPTAEITEVRFKNSGRGIVDGGGIGFIAGAVTSLIIGMAVVGDEVGSKDEAAVKVTGELAGVLMAPYFGGAGAVVGMIIGGVIGSKEKFLLTEPTVESE